MSPGYSPTPALLRKRMRRMETQTPLRKPNRDDGSEGAEPGRAAAALPALPAPWPRGHTPPPSPSGRRSPGCRIPRRPPRGPSASSARHNRGRWSRWGRWSRYRRRRPAARSGARPPPSTAPAPLHHVTRPPRSPSILSAQPGGRRPRGSSSPPPPALLEGAPRF